MTHNGKGNGEAQQEAALRTQVESPVVESTGETQITGRVGVASNQSPLRQSAQIDGGNADQRVESQGFASNVPSGPQTQSATIERGSADQGLGFVPAGPQMRSASDNKFDKMLETMNNMATAMATQAQSIAASAPSVGLSSLRSTTVDTKGILTVEDYWGEEDKFLSWKRILYSAFEAINPLWQQACKHIETDTKRKIPLRSLTPEESTMAHDIHRFLLHKCKGDAATRVQSSEDGNGFEAWILLCDSKLPKSSTAPFAALMDHVFSSNDPRLNLQQWDKDALRYEEHFGEKVPETMRRSIYQNRIAPKDVNQHLLLNASLKLVTALETRC